MKRLFAVMLCFCLVLNLTACGSHTPSLNVDTSESSTTETTSGRQYPSWDLRVTRGRITEADPIKTHIQLMDYESTNEAVEFLFRNLEKGSERYTKAIETWTYPSDYFDENSLFIVQRTEYRDKMTVLDVYIEQGKLNIICKKPSNYGFSTGAGSNYCYFIEIYDYVPASADDIVFEVSYPKL